MRRAAWRWRLLEARAGTAYAALNATAGDSAVFPGHPVTAFDPDAVLSLAQVSDRQRVLGVHNPAAHARELAWDGARLSVGAGRSRFLGLASRVPAG